MDRAQRHSRHRRPVVRGGPFATSPWLRAPVLLLRRPVVLLAIAAATAVLGVAAASGALFVSTLDTASLQAQAADDCPEFSMPSFTADVTGPNIAKENSAGLAAMRHAGALGQPYSVDITSATIQSIDITLFSRTGALAHVHTLTPDTGAPGVWMPSDVAAQLHARPGDVLHTAATGAPIRVAGLYRPLAPDPFHLANLPRYWCTWTDLIVQKPTGNEGTPALVISDAATVAAVNGSFKPSQLDVLNGGFGSSGVTSLSVYDPIPYGTIPLGAARAADRRAATAATSFFAGAPFAAGNPEAQAPAVNPLDPEAKPADPLAQKIAVATRVRSGLSGSVWPIDIAGVIVAGLLVAGAGAFWAAHRSREIVLLGSRGVGPVPLGAKAVLETAPAVIAGLAVGVVAAWLLVRAAGPTPVLGPGALGSAIVAAVAAGVLGLLVIGIIGARAGRDRVIGARRSAWRLVPWELALVAVAVWLGIRIHADGGVAVDHTVVSVKAVLLLFPLLGSAAVLLLAGRLTGAALPRLGRLARRAGSAWYLGLRRIAGSRAITVGLLVATALPCALLTYAGTVTGSVEHELTRKVQTSVGAPHVLNLIGAHEQKPRLDGHGTAVVSYQTEPRLPGDVEVAVLGVDPATFTKFAYLDGDQRSAVALLHPTAPGTAAPAVLVNAPSGLDPHRVTIGSAAIPIDVAARAEVFPGLRSSYPMIVVDRTSLAHLAHADLSVDRLNEVWTSSAELGAVSRAIQRDGYSVIGELDPQLRIGNTGLLPLTWIFGYLRALAIMIGAVAIAGLVFALGARTRRRTVSYVMSRRMGLTQATHLRSLLAELALVVGLGWAAGAAVGTGAFAAIVASLDIYPSLPPPAAYALPAGILLVTALVVAAVILLAAVATHARAERARPAEILRLE